MSLPTDRPHVVGHAIAQELAKDESLTDYLIYMTPESRDRWFRAIGQVAIDVVEKLQAAQREERREGRRTLKQLLDDGDA